MISSWAVCGPEFDIARLLSKRGILFVFLAGYDPETIPAEMADGVRLLRDVVEAVVHLKSHIEGC